MPRLPGTTTEEILTVNGVVLNTYAKNIESLTGRLRAPAKRTSNVVVSGRHGAVRTRGKKYDQNLIVLPMWVIGAEDDGSIPADETARRLFFRNINDLTKLFKENNDEELDIRHTLPDGSVRQCFGDVLDAIDFTTETANPLGKFGVSITMANPFWQDLVEQETQVAASGDTVTLANFRGATAPMEDLVVTITGPWANPVLTFADGSWVAYDDSFQPGEGIEINSGVWGLSGVGGIVPSLEKLRYGGTSSHWIALPPAGEDAPEVQLFGGIRTNNSQLAVRGRRKYLVG